MDTRISLLISGLKSEIKKLHKYQEKIWETNFSFWQTKLTQKHANIYFSKTLNKINSDQRYSCWLNELSRWLHGCPEKKMLSLCKFFLWRLWQIFGTFYEYLSISWCIGFRKAKMGEITAEKCGIVFVLENAS